MFHSRWIFLATLISFSALGEVSFQEKVNRVEYLEELQAKVPAMDIEAYRRELHYEKMGLSLEEKVRSEALLVSEQIKKQVALAYEAALAEKSAPEAMAEVREAIEKDSALIAPELREEIKSVSFKTLEDIHNQTIVSEQENLTGLQKALKPAVKERADFLNEEGVMPHISAFSENPELPSVRKSRDGEKKDYRSKAEVIESLISDRESVRFVSTSGGSVSSSISVKAEANVSYQIKAEFLGVSVSAGPKVTFERTYLTNAVVLSEGLHPPVLADGNFDFYKRDRNGRPIVRGGKVEKRYISFFCEASLEFGTVGTYEGGFSVVGVGASAVMTGSYRNKVELDSRRILVPETIAGKTVTFKDLANLCHMDFLRGRVTTNLTVAGSLNTMMRNVIQGLRYSHPKTKCAKDAHCFRWFNAQSSLIRRKNYPRCVVESGPEKILKCDIRGQKGQSCPVYDSKGKRISEGELEFNCDFGLRCVKVQEAGWFQGWDVYQYAKGKCM